MSHYKIGLVKGLLPCDQCPHLFECPLKAYPEHRRDKLCLFKTLPLIYSKTTYPLKAPLLIPDEKYSQWTNRLKGFIDRHSQ